MGPGGGLEGVGSRVLLVVHQGDPPDRVVAWPTQGATHAAARAR